MHAQSCYNEGTGELLLNYRTLKGTAEMKKIALCSLLLTAAAVSLLLLASSCSEDHSDSTESTGAEQSVTVTQTAESTEPGSDTEDDGQPTEEELLMLSENKYAAAALEQVEMLIAKYYDKPRHMVKTSLSDSYPAYVWPVASFLEALSEMYILYPDNETIRSTYLDCLDRCLTTYRVNNATITNPETGQTFTKQTYYNSSRSNAGDFYYDDNAWICIRFITAYEQFGDEKYLDNAKAILEFLWTGWDEYQGGGIYWSSKFSDGGKSSKGACTNAPACISYLWMYRLTNEELYLERGKLLFDWLVATLRDTKGLYFAGVGDPWQACYDQGTMMYATTLMYEIEQDKSYLDLARRSYFAITSHIFSVDLSSGEPDVYMNRNPIFKAWCVGWLVRGLNKYYTVDSAEKTLFMQYMEEVLDKTLATKDENGQYDPFFCSPGSDFWDKDYYDNEVIMPAGVTAVLAQAAYFDVFLRGSNDSLS